MLVGGYDENNNIYFNIFKMVYRLFYFFSLFWELEIGRDNYGVCKNFLNLIILCLYY